MMEDKEHMRKIMKVRHCVCKHSYRHYIRIWTAQVVSSNSVRKTDTFLKVLAGVSSQAWSM